MGPSRGMSHRTSTKGHMTPLFGGGSLSSFSVSRVGSGAGRFTGDNHSGMREIEESGFAAFLVLTMSHPPSERVTKIIGRCDIENSLSGYPLYSSCPDGGTIALIYQLLVGRQMPIGCLGAVCFTANLWLKRQNHPESPAKSTGTNAGSRPDMSVLITRVKWITRNSLFPVSLSGAHLGRQTARPAMSNSRQSRLLP